MNIRLVVPTSEYKEKIWDYKAEFVGNGDVMHGCAGLSNAQTFEEWYSTLLDNSKEETVHEGLVPETAFIAVDENDRIVGMIDIRHRLSEYLLNYGGHIGYSVRKSERKKGYATQMLKLALGECIKLGIERALITCYKDNIASVKTIIKNGGILENEVDNNGVVIQRYWIEV